MISSVFIRTVARPRNFAKTLARRFLSVFAGRSISTTPMDSECLPARR
jgi:hypothetical protein